VPGLAYDKLVVLSGNFVAVGAVVMGKRLCAGAEYESFEEEGNT
jgi:hypothetical protein